MLTKTVQQAAASEETRRTLRYVESLSEARTTLADFFSILSIGRAYEGAGIVSRRVWRSDTGQLY
jgi:hypothetical protein